MPVPDHYDRVNPDLLALIPRDARTIVEVVCGAGSLGAAYKRFNPFARYIGVDSNLAALRVARERLDAIEPCDIENFADYIDVWGPEWGHDLAFQPGDVDCLVLGDVLEHLSDPWTCLRRMVGWLREGGQVVACIPNVQHWSVIVGLLRGDWTYRDEGLLDRAHLRFFTMESALRLFRDAGLQVYWLSPREAAGGGGESYLRLMDPVIRALGVDPARFDLGSRAAQYVVGGVKASEPPAPLLIQTIYGSYLGGDVRVREPDAFLATIPGVTIREVLSAGDIIAPAGGTQSILIRQRNLLEPATHLAEQREFSRQGHLIVAEFDDDPDHFAAVVRGGYFALSACHAVQTTTPRLAETLRAYHPHVRVFANQIGSLPPRRSYGDGPVTVFFGALNREKDWEPILPALNRVLDEFGARVLARVVHDRAFFEAIETPWKEFEPTCSYERYRAILGTADVALLPLGPTRFNEHKSDLKFLECAAHGVACLASPTVYAGSIREGETGVIYRDAEEFERGLRLLLDDEGVRRRIASAAYEEVARDRVLALHYRERYEWYLGLLAEKERWDAELRARHPELFLG